MFIKLYWRVIICWWVLPSGIWLSVAPAYGQVIESPEITSLMNRWAAYNLEHSELRGYRIQILATVDRRQMESVRQKFENLYPEYPIHTTHNDPYFQLQTGAFLTMQKAQAFLKMMQKDYPSSIPVTDDINVDELLLYDQ
jgi:hypothetical protein